MATFSCAPGKPGQFIEAMLKEISNEIKSAFRHNQNGVTQLLVINIAVFVLVGFCMLYSWASNSPRPDGFFLEYLGLSSDPLQFLFKPWTLITYGIVHLDIQHFIFNMIGLYMFGQILQDFLGPRKILNFYFFGTLSGGLLFLLIFSLISKSSMAPPSTYLLGASGAVYGIICGAAFLVPNYSVHLLFLGPVRIKYIAVGFVLISFLQIPYGNAGGNIAHLGGALGGILYLKYLQGAFKFSLGRKPRPIIKGRVVSLETRKTILSQEEELNLLLDKISERGIQSLTREERNRLEYLSKPTSSND